MVRFIGTVSHKKQTIRTQKSSVDSDGHGGNSPGTPSGLADAECQRIEKETGLNESTIRKCFTAFKLLDDDLSGYLDTKEVSKLLANLDNPVSENEVVALLAKMDQDQSGMLDFEEFVQLFRATANYKGPSLQSQIESVCKVLQGEMQGQRKTAAERAQEEGIPEKKIQQYLRKEINEAEACLSLPWGFALFLFFFISMSAHEQTSVQNAMDHAIETDILENANFAFSGIIPFENGRMGFKAAPDVNSIPDWYSWMTLGLVPLIWPETWDVSESRANVLAMCTTPASTFPGVGWPITTGSNTSNHNNAQKGHTYTRSIFDATECAEEDPKALPEEFYGAQPHNLFLFYNRILGGLRLRTEVGKGKVCDGGPIDTAPCYPGKYWLAPELHEGLNTDLSSLGQVVILRTGLAREKILRQVRQLENDQWLTPDVHKVEVTFITYNGNLDAITATYLNFFITHSGQIWKKVEPNTLWLTAYPSFFHYIPDLVWFGMTLKIFFAESADILSYIRQLGCIHGLHCYIGFWNSVDWISVFYGFFMVFLWMQHLASMGDLKDQLLTADRTLPGEWPEDSSTIKFMESMDSIVLTGHQRRKVFAIYPFVCVLRLMKGFDAQARLAVMTRTLSFAVTDILHFGLIFISVFLVFAMSAMALFGQELYQFAKLDRAMNTCWRVLNGDIVWDEMNDIGRFEAGLWFWSFTILVQLVILNMLVALIMDTYQGVRAGMGDAETLWSQSAEIWKRRKAILAGRQMPLEKVLLALDDTPLDDGDADEEDERCLSLRGLLERVPALPLLQAQDIMENTIKLLEDEEHEDLSLSQAMQRTQNLRERQLEIQRSLEALFYLCQCMSDHLGPEPKLSSMESPITEQAPVSIQADSAEATPHGGGDVEANAVNQTEKAIEVVPVDPAELIASQILTDSINKALDDAVCVPVMQLVQRHGVIMRRGDEVQSTLQNRFSVVDRKLNAMLASLRRERIVREELHNRGKHSSKGGVCSVSCSKDTRAPDDDHMKPFLIPSYPRNRHSVWRG